MKIIIRKIPVYRFELTIILFNTKEVQQSEVHKYAEFMENIVADKESTNDLLNKVMNGCANGGDTLYRNISSKFITVIYPHSTLKELHNTLMHEKRHIEDFIIRDCDLQCMEAAAYLAGDLTQFFLDDEIINYYKF